MLKRALRSAPLLLLATCGVLTGLLGQAAAEPPPTQGTGSGGGQPTSAPSEPAESESVQPASAQPRSAQPRSAQSAAEVVNINSADAEALQRLPGIGPAKADAILALRARLKRFKRPEQLMRVRGIGRKTFRKLRPLLTLDGATTLQHKASSRRRVASASTNGSAR